MKKETYEKINKPIYRKLIIILIILILLFLLGLLIWGSVIVGTEIQKNEILKGALLIAIPMFISLIIFVNFSYLIYYKDKWQHSFKNMFKKESIGETNE